MDEGMGDTPAPRGPSRLGGLAARAGALTIATLAGLLGITLVAALLLDPTLRNASAALAVDLSTPEETELPPLHQRSIVYAADGSVLAVLHDEIDRRVVTLDDIPDHVVDAVLTAEDRKFWEHEGYDVEGMGRAAVANVQARGITQGGSTLTQQLAKQNFLGGHDAEQTIERKASELLYAMALEDRMSKEELLERYLNQVYFGAGAYGIAAAAEEFFGVDQSELTHAQAALLAGVIRSPGALDPRRNADGATRRRDAVLQAMGAEAYLTAEEVQNAVAEPLEVQPRQERETTEPYFIEAVKRELIANPVFGETFEERWEALFGGGLRIHTTLDQRLQDIADDVISEQYPGPDGPTAAIAAVEPETGRILTLQSGADFTVEQFDLAAQGRRQPGSAFKPFVLAAALENGYPLRLRVAGSSPTEFDEPDWSEPWSVSNYGGASYGMVDLRSAMRRSVNTAFAQLILMVGTDEVVDVSERLGLDMDAATAGDIVPAMALGGLGNGVTPLEMASAYGVFANAGERAAPHVIDRVTDANDEELFATDTAPEQVIEPAVAGAMVDVLQDVVSGGTGTGARLAGWSPLGKTGTTQRNADAWFTGAVAPLSTAVWVGHPDSLVRMPGMTGGSVPATLWQRFMTRALEGVDPVDFPEVDQDLEGLVDGEPTDVPDVRRMTEAEALRRLGEAMLIGQVRREDSRAPEGTVIWQSPSAGASARGGDLVTIGVSTGRPPPPPPPPDPTPTPTPDEEFEEPATRPDPDDPDARITPSPSPAPPPPPRDDDPSEGLDS